MSATISGNVSKRTRRAVVAAALIGLTMGAGSAAQAADFCFTGGLYSIVGKGFRVPTKGRCKPFAGWKEFVFGGTYVVTGTACTSLIGDFVDLNLISQPASNIDTQFESIRLPLKAGAPDTFSYQKLNGSGAANLPGGGQGIPCSRPYNP